jgi:hypothetical protein
LLPFGTEFFLPVSSRGVKIKIYGTMILPVALRVSYLIPHLKKKHHLRMLEINVEEKKKQEVEQSIIRIS